MLAKGQFPTRENCDPSNPDEAFLWMFVALPDELHMPMVYHRLISKRFWDLGARPVEEPLLQLVPPGSVKQSWVTPGYWTPLGDLPEVEQKPVHGATLPTRENCDSSNPEEAFLWMWVALPHVRGGPMILSEAAHRKDSKHLWHLGARPAAEPVLEYVPVSAAQPDWATSGGSWVSAGSISPVERERREMASGLGRLGHAQRKELSDALQANRDGATTDSKAAHVVASMNPRQRALAWELLHDAA